MILTSLLLILSAPIPKDGKPPPALTAKEAGAVRRGVVELDLAVVQDLDEPAPRLEVPKGLVAIHAAKPAAVLDLLARIVDGGRVDDAFRAVCLAVALVDGPQTAAMHAEVGRETRATFDEYSAKLERTPREHWVSKVRAMAREK